MSLVVRTTGKARNAADAIRQAEAQIDPGVVVSDIQTMQDLVDDSVAAAVPVVYPRRICGDGAAAGLLRDLWRAFIRGGTADGGDRDSDGARGSAGTDTAGDAAAGNGSSYRWADCGRGGLGGIRTTGTEPVIRH